MGRKLTQEDRAFAEDMGYAICEECQDSYPPLPGWVNDGHQCNEDGTAPKFMLPLTHKYLKSLDYPLEEREKSIASADKDMLERYGVVIPRPHPDDQTD